LEEAANVSAVDNLFKQVMVRWHKNISS